MNYAEIGTYQDCSNPQEVAKGTIHTVGSLIEELSRLDPSLPVVVRFNSEMYGGLTGVRIKEDLWEDKG